MTRTTMPPWLSRLLEQTGRADGDGVSRRARTTFCRTCGAVTCVGLDADVLALAARVDVTPLTPRQELSALLDGRPTYELHWAGDRYLIERRDSYRISGHPAGRAGIHVVAEHKCGHPTGTPVPLPVPNVESISEEPMF